MTELQLLAEQELENQRYMEEQEQLDEEYYEYLVNDWLDCFRDKFAKKHGRPPTIEEEEAAFKKTTEKPPRDDFFDDDLPW